MQLFDALFNWLQIKVVADARPDDRSAIDTKDFFEEILTEDHKITKLEVEDDATMYHVRYQAEGGSSKTQMFDKEQVEKLLDDINNEPRYNQSFDDC